MSGTTGRGLGGFQFDRDEAAKKLYTTSAPPPEPPDQPEVPKAPDTSPDQAKEAASNSASSGGDVDVKETGVASTSATVENTAPPPPAHEPVARVQFNQRIRSDRRKALDRYRRHHGSTWQAILDQMVDEYLDRRGLLPPEQ